MRVLGRRLRSANPRNAYKDSTGQRSSELNRACNHRHSLGINHISTVPSKPISSMSTLWRKEDAVAYEAFRKLNGLRPKPAKKVRPTCRTPRYRHCRGQNQPMSDTYASDPCVLCNVVDDICGLVCDTCDAVEHVKCMPVAPRDRIPEGGWHCASCITNSKLDTRACESCGVRDDQAEE